MGQIKTRLVHTSSASCAEEGDGSSKSKGFSPGEKMRLQNLERSDMVSKEVFKNQDEKNKETFKRALEHFVNRDNRRRGAVEFISAALKNMELYGVQKDLETYRAIFEILPKGKYVPTNLMQAGFGHYPKQQDCALGVLDKMAENRVIPDEGGYTHWLE